MKTLYIIALITFMCFAQPKVDTSGIAVLIIKQPSENWESFFGTPDTLRDTCICFHSYHPNRWTLVKPKSGRMWWNKKLYYVMEEK